MSLPSVFDRAYPGILAFFLAALPIAAQDIDATEALTRQIRSVFERCKDAVVKIEAVDRHGSLSGTGFFIDPSGTVFTSYTIGGETSGITVRHGEKSYPATRLIGDSRSGIAILKIDADTPFLTASPDRYLPPATPILLVGYGMDAPVSPSLGVIAGYDATLLGRHFATAHIRASMPVQRGQGGAPVVNLRGETIGMLISAMDNGAGCFILPIAAAEKVHKDLVRFGETRPGWIGVKVGELRDPIDRSRAMIDGFIEGSPASKSGLREGDCLVQIGDYRITTPEDVVSAAFFMTAGDPVPISVIREGERHTFQIEATQSPSTKGQTAAVPPFPGMPVPPTSGDR